ncbi:fructose bisphosphate aldolase [Pontixanthobacter aestiaquae]|uniref:fructose-bisphosphate aldolase n=1 Tax=Pontixanthobacter aestiaquae TaxID=1509367 RepID=A0A844ZC75_9SPHN|nr:fructose bisphosphate aldolase [Pontixanthobacter aestiaquae]MDN3645574.1 fructose bisphosphate aldolase [Pontixanthobacter aestiaquae]MXO83429.1 fructose bisphosphate aldolase [Pontixanthobacter aestiaquae]
MNTAEMTAKMAAGQGFIAALDQSGGSTPKALKGYGVEESEYSGDEEMFAKIHQMRCRIVTSPSFNGNKVVGAILFEKTMNGCTDDGTPVPTQLSNRGIVPFLKVDAGMHEAENGVQLMKDMPRLDELCARGKELGVYGTKMRSVIHEANADGVAANVRQQMDFGLRILDNGLMPILEPEASLSSESRAEAEEMLLTSMQEQLDRLGDDQQVMLKLTIPAKPNLYQPLVDHPKVLRVVALSGGYSREEAVRELAKNTGMIASFSRALLEELRAQMDDQEFDAALSSAIDEIHAASIAG